MTSPSFPDRAGLEKSQDGQEYIYGGSVGLNRLLGYLHDSAHSPTRTEWGAVLVSLYTIAHMVYHKDQTKEQFLAGIRQDCDLLTLYVEAYAGAAPGTIKRPLLVFYLPDYRALPAALCRPHSPARVRFEEAYAGLCRHFSSGVTDFTQRDGASLRFTVTVGERGELPHFELARWVRSMLPHFAREGSYRRGDALGLLTHAPVDLHLHRHLPQLYLWERYTGHIKEPSKFGQKLERGTHVPFTIALHRLLGDEVHIAPLLRGKERAAFLALAEKNQWDLLPVDRVLQEAARASGVSVAELIRVKL